MSETKFPTHTDLRALTPRNLHFAKQRVCVFCMVLTVNSINRLGFVADTQWPYLGGP
jgi:hypothetical protein